MIAIRHGGESLRVSADDGAEENPDEHTSLPISISQRGIEILTVLNEVFDGLESEETAPEWEATPP